MIETKRFRVHGALRLLLVLLAPVASSTPLVAQPATTPESPAPRQATVMAGFGADFGWAGVQTALYFLGDRASVFFGIGGTPDLNDGLGNTSGVTAAAGVRVFLPGSLEQWFIEANVSRMPDKLESRAICTLTCAPVPRTVYGPGLLAGYQYSAVTGLTLLASAGAGYSPAKGLEPASIEPRVSLGLGFTWR